MNVIHSQSIFAWQHLPLVSAVMFIGMLLTLMSLRGGRIFSLVLVSFLNLETRENFE